MIPTSPGLVWRTNEELYVAQHTKQGLTRVAEGGAGRTHGISVADTQVEKGRGAKVWRGWDRKEGEDPELVCCKETPVEGD